MTEYRCSVCETVLTVWDHAPPGYHPNWMVGPCKCCLDALEEATKDELNDDWTKDYDKLKADLEERTEELNVSQDKLRDVEHELTKVKGELAEEIELCGVIKRRAVSFELLRDVEIDKLKAELQATKLLLKDAQQAHVFAKFRADRLSKEED